MPMTKPTNEALAVVGVLLGITGLLATFGTAQTHLVTRIGISNDTLVLLGILLMICGGCLVLSRIGLVIWRRARRSRSPLPIVQAQTATRVDLPELHALYVHQFEEDAPSLGQMQRWYSRTAKSSGS